MFINECEIMIIQLTKITSNLKTIRAKCIDNKEKI